jgi:FkbM family methyltransferase
MRLHLDDELSRLIYCDEFEMAERLFLNRFLQPGDVFVDVGCNIGLFTLIAARRVREAGHVYGFEPCSRTFARLEANLRLNAFANVTCVRTSLSDRRGEATLTAPLDGYGAWGSLAHPVRGHSFTTETVATIPWDDFAQEHRLIGRVTAMKIDVEGWEARVLSGASKTLSRGDAPLLQVEFTEEAAWSAGSSCAGIYRLLEEFGYQMFTYDVERGRLVPDPLRESYPYLNVIAAKRPDDVMARLKHRSWFRLSGA